MCSPPTDHLQDIELGELSSTTDFSADTRPLINTTPSKDNRNRASHHDTNSNNNNNDDAIEKPNEDSGLGSKILDSLPPTQQIIVLSFFMFLFFGMHNILQEAIVNLLSTASDSIQDELVRSNLKSNGTLMLGYAEVVGVLLFSYLERTHMTTEGGFSRVAPLRAFPLLTLCLFASSSLSNLSLSYINFPTKVGKYIIKHHVGEPASFMSLANPTLLYSSHTYIFHINNSLQIMQTSANNDHSYHLKCT